MSDFLFDDVDAPKELTFDLLGQRTIIKLKCYYLRHSAKETCEHFGIEYSPAIAKMLHRLWPKGMGHGGARR